MNAGSATDWLLLKFIRHRPVDFNAGVTKSQEERRLIWTTFANINCWFDNWQKILVPFRFGTIQDDRKVVVLDEEKSCILNLDEKALLLDGRTQQHGEHPKVSFYDGALTVVGLSVAKNS